MSNAFDFSIPKQNDAANIFPRFYIRAVHNAFKSEQSGRAIYDDIEYVEIMVAGDRNTAVDRRVKDEDRERWPQAYAAFKSGQEMATSGTPLEEWPALTPGMIMEYKAMHIKTVEALAALDDGKLGALGTGGRTIRDKAKAWLERAESDAPLTSALAGIESLKGDKAVLQSTINAQAAEIERLKSKIVEQAQ